MRIRSAELGDDAAIWSMLEPVFRSGETYAVDPAISRDDALAYWRGGRVWLAEHDGLPLGTFTIRPNQAGGGGHVCNAAFVTADAAQGRGVARAMLEAAVTEARKLGFEAMQFNFVLESNARAVALWQRNGFEIIGRVPRAFRLPTGEMTDALVMHRFL